MRELSLFVVLTCLLLGGCAELGYYGHALNGQLEVVCKRRPITEVIADPETAPQVRRKLEYIERAHDFAIGELYLPDSETFRGYSDVGRDYVLWNVFATPQFSFEQKQWCYPFIGCLGYRSYFNKAYAHEIANELATKGWDVYVAESPAYSTRGVFADPVYNPILRYPDTDIAGILFHELAHEHIFLKDDSQANESFAVTVQNEGVRRWLDHLQQPEAFASYSVAKHRDDEFIALLIRYRKKLLAIYQSDMSVVIKAASKRRTFNLLRRDYLQLKRAWGGYSGFDHWFERPLNNAALAPVATYHGDVPVFTGLLQQHDNNLEAFYSVVRELAGLEAAERRKRLDSLRENSSFRNMHSTDPESR